MAVVTEILCGISDGFRLEGKMATHLHYTHIYSLMNHTELDLLQPWMRLGLIKEQFLSRGLDEDNLVNDHLKS